MNTKLKLRFAFLISIIMLAAFSRCIPHIDNFSPLTAIGLFGAAHFDKKWKAFVIPITATWLSDLFLNNIIYTQYYPEFTLFYQGFYWQYGSYLLITLLGYIIFNKITRLNVLIGSLLSTVIFFLISNFGSWLGSTMYTQNFEGLIQCYIAGIPFIQGTLLGGWVYSSILFGGYYILQNKVVLFKLPNVKYA